MADMRSVDDLRGMLGTEVAAAFKAVQAERDALEVAYAALHAAFVRHRTATHVAKPLYCETCRKADAALAANPPSARGAELLAAAERMAKAIERWNACDEPHRAYQTETDLDAALAAWRALAPGGGTEGVQG